MATDVRTEPLTAVEPPPHPDPRPGAEAKPVAPWELRFVLDGVSWQTYKALGDDLERAGSHVFVTYDNGRMELMATGRTHDVYSRAVVNLMSILSEEVEISISPTGSVTHQREDLGKGFEPDESFYIKNEHRMLGKKTLELPADPPADLTIEIDITSNSRNRLGVFAAVGVPEVWRFDGETITVHALQEDGRYTVVPESPNFPWLPMAGVVRFLNSSLAPGRLEWLKAVREWVRREVVPRARGEA